MGVLHTRRYAEETHQSMLVQAATFAPKTTTPKTSTAKGGATN
jgi:hypothetical protein